MRFFKLSGFGLLASALALPMGTAIAQDTQEDEALEEIITTGSRIVRKDLEGSAAVTVLDEEAIRVTGNVSIGDVLQDLTVNSNGINVQANNGGDGSTRINLRGLGTSRTLVLVNGRRMVTTATAGSVDLNAIPLASIERVEVLKDGASAIYGSDAVAGVVNIITRTDFEGIEINAFTGQSGESDGEIVDVNLTLGVANDRGNVLVSAGFYEQDPIFAGDREFSFFDKEYDWDANDGSFSELGSTAPPEGHIIDRLGQAGNQAWQDLIAQYPTDCCFFNDPSAGWRPFQFTGTSDIGTGDYYNYQPINYLLTPQRRFNVYAAGRYELSPDISAFVESSYLNRQSDQLLAPTPLFIISEGITVSSANYYNPFGRDFIDVRRRFLEAGGRNFLQDIDTFRTVAGFQGDLPGDKNWTWEFYGNYGRTQGSETNVGRFIRSRMINAIGPSADLDGDGTPECYQQYDSATDTYSGLISGCVPVNLFGGAAVDPISQDAINYISYEGMDMQEQSQRSFALNFTGDAFEMPAGPVGVAVGLEYREERGANIPDPITNAGDTTGNKQEKTRGSYDVTEAYLELLVPVLESVELSLAVRHSDYSNFGTTTNGKVGLIWDVTDSFTLRGTVSEAFRAPTIFNLFGGNADSFPLSTDPCDTLSGPRTANEQANCAADGLPDDYQDSRVQLKSTIGGNPDAQPEEADTFTAGFVYQPEWADGLSFTADWWDVELVDAITGVGVTVILSQCYNQPPAERALCDKVIRDATGFLQVVDNRTTNVGGLEASGLDMTFTYDQSTSVGDFRYHLDLAYMDEFTIEQADGSLVNGIGVYDLGVYPEWKANFNLNYARDNWRANYNLRYTHDFIECESNDCGALDDGDPATTVAFRDVDSYFQHDIQVSYDLDWNDAGQGSITFGVQNLFDEDPSKIFNGFLATSDETEYDFLGRYFYLSYRHTL